MPSGRKTKPNPDKSAKKRTWKQTAFLFLCAIVGTGFLLTVIPVLAFRAVNPPTTPLMWIRWQEKDFPKTHSLILKSWKPIEEISPNLVKAVIAGEDQNFFAHNGVDWEAAEAAFKHNLNSRRKIGASTISMQTARNVFLWQDRTWFRKTLEVYFTWLIELVWTKHRILEVYLNVIEWGDGIFGCEQAARAYFHRPAKTLSPLEAAKMASILPSPRKWSIDTPGQAAMNHLNAIMKWMSFIQIPAK